MPVSPKGPTGSLIAASAEEYKNDPLGFLTRCQSQFGNVVKMDFEPVPHVFLYEPDLIQEVLVTQATNFIKDISLSRNRRFFGNGLLSSEGDFWKKQRKLAAPAFSPKRLEIYGATMVEHTEKMLANWQDGSQLDIQHEMMRLTLGIATKTLFDVDLNEDNVELEEGFTDAQIYLNERMIDQNILQLPESEPLPVNINLQKAIEKVDKVVYRIIEERRGKTEGRTDLLSTLLSARDEDGKAMSDQQVRDEVFTLFFAGHDTTALTLTWTLYLLALNPQIEERLLAELKQALNGRSPQVSDYASLPYTEKIIRESMRVRPAVWSIAREAACDVTLGDYEIRKGTSVVMSQWVMHNDTRFYKDPEKFDPDRWSPEFIESLPKFAYFPFGGGPRTCIGNTFAILEALLALAAIVQEFHLDLLPDPKVELAPMVTLRPTHGIAMRLQKR